MTITIRVPSVLVAKALAGVISQEGFCNAVAKQAANESANVILLPQEASSLIGTEISVQKMITRRTLQGLRQGVKRWTATIQFTGNVSESVVSGMKIVAEQQQAAQAEKAARAAAPAPTSAPKAPKTKAPAYAADAFVVASWASFNTLLALAAGSKKALERVTAEAVKREATQIVLPAQAAASLSASGMLAGVSVIATGPLPQKPLAEMTAKVEAAQAAYAQKQRRGTGMRAANRGIGSAGKTARTGGKAAADAKKAERRARDQALRNQMRGNSNKKD